MRPTLHVITLVVNDLEKATAFYRDGLGLPTQGIVEGFKDHVLFELQAGLSLVLYIRPEFIKISGEPLSTSPNHNSQTILSYFTANKEEVDDILRRAVNAGATLQVPPKEEPWGGYGGYFKDQDGHFWEIMWNPHFAE